MLAVTLQVVKSSDSKAGKMPHSYDDMINA